MQVSTIFAMLIVTSTSASLGIDFGNEYNKAALIAPGKLFVMVENKISKRKSPSYLTFLNNSRLHENPAENKSVKTSQNSFYFMNKFFGKCGTSEELLTSLQEELLQQFDIRCDDVGTLFRLKKFKFDLSKAVGMKYRKEFGLEPKKSPKKEEKKKEEKQEENAEEGEKKEEEEKEEKEEEEKEKEMTDEEVMEKIYGNIFRKSEEVGEHEYRLEELYAMQLENLRENAENTGEARFTSAVLTIWNNDMSISSRKQLADSMWLAGMKPLAFVHENTAAALKQSIDIKATKDYESEQVVYVNLGSAGGKISLIEFDKVEAKAGFKKEKDYNVSLKVLEDSFDEKVGGNHLNKCLYEIVMKKFFEKLGKDWREEKVREKNLRGLMLSLKKKKHILSVNNEVSVYFEEFWNNKDLNVQVTSEELKEECSHLLDNLDAFFRNFKKKVTESELDFGNVKRVELIGGAVRNPFVRQKIEDFWKEEDAQVYNHLNGDEAMAIGASFVAANYSSSFRARPIFVNDGPGYNVEVKVHFPSEEDPQKANKSSMLFPRKKSRYGHKKTMTLSDIKADFNVQLVADDEDNFTVDYKVAGFERALKSMEGKNITEFKTNLYFEMDLMGVPKLKKADIKMKEEYWEEVKVKIEKKEEDKKGEEEEKGEEKKGKEEVPEKEEKKEESKEEEKKEEEKKDEEKKEEDKKDDEKTEEKEKKEDGESKEEEKKPEEPEYEIKNELKSRNLVINLSISQTEISVKSLKDYPKEWKKSKRLLKVFKEEEEQRKKILTMKNELESAMYELKEIVNDDEGKARFLSEEDKEKWLKFAGDLEEFIFFTRPTQGELESKKWEMKKMRKDFDYRLNEWRERDVLIEMVMKAFNDMQNQITKIQKNNSDIPDSEVMETQMKVESAREWLNGVKSKLDAQKLFENPEITKKQIFDKKEEMTRLIYKLRHYKKPKEKAAPKDDKLKNMRERLMKDLKLDPKLMEGMTDEQLNALLEGILKDSAKMKPEKDDKKPEEDQKKEGESKESQEESTKKEEVNEDKKNENEDLTNVNEDEKVETDDGTKNDENQEEILNNTGDEITKDL